LVDPAQLEISIQERAYWWAGVQSNCGRLSADGRRLPRADGLRGSRQDRGPIFRTLEGAEDRGVSIAAHGAPLIELSGALIGVSNDEARDCGFIRLSNRLSKRLTQKLIMRIGLGEKGSKRHSLF
jgi:hypothetical protein